MQIDKINFYCIATENEYDFLVVSKYIPDWLWNMHPRNLYELYPITSFDYLKIHLK